MNRQLGKEVLIAGFAKAGLLIKRHFGGRNEETEPDASPA